MCCRRLHEVMDLLQNEVLLYHFQLKYSLFFYPYVHIYTYICFLCHDRSARHKWGSKADSENYRSNYYLYPKKIWACVILNRLISSICEETFPRR